MYVQDRLFEEDEPPSWVYLESPLSERPRSLDALHPREIAQRRRRILGLAIVVALLCVVGAFGAFQVLGGDDQQAPDETNAPAADSESDTPPRTGLTGSE